MRWWWQQPKTFDLNIWCRFANPHVACLVRDISRCHLFAIIQMSIFVRCNQWLRGQLWEQSFFWHKFLFHLISFVDFFRGTKTYSSVCMELRFLLLFHCRVLLLAVLNPSRTTQPYNPFTTSSSGWLCYSCDVKATRTITTRLQLDAKMQIGAVEELTIFYLALGT